MKSGQALKASLMAMPKRIFRKAQAWLIRVLGLQNRIGIQFQADDGAVIHYNEVVKPRAWLSIAVTKREFLEQAVEANPGALPIYRPFPDHDWADDPEGRAEEYVERLRRECADVWDLFGAFVDNNEYVFPFDPPERIEAADRYMARVVELLATLGKKAVVLNAATGNWGDDIIRFPRMLEALRKHGGFIGFHEYDWPAMWRAHEQGLAKGNEGMWQCLRWKRAARAIRAAYGGWCPQFIITECGLERKVVGDDHGGFRVYSDDLAVAVENYVKSLRWYYDNLDDDVFAIILFGCGMVKPWDGWGFDVKGTTIPDEIKLFPVTPPPEPEPPPNGGNEMDLTNVRVYKLKEDYSGHVECGTLDDKEALVFGKYGAAFRRAQVAKGQKVYRLTEIWEKTGNSSLITQVLNEDGSPMANVDVAFYWPDAPAPSTPIYAHDWYKNFVHGPTNINGDVGPGMGPGAYHGEGEGGPHAVWVRDPNIPSDICEKLGMLAGTFHDHLDQKFQLVVEGGEEPEPEPPNGGEMLVLDKRVEGNHPLGAIYILWPVEVSYDTNARGGIVSGQELNVSNPVEVTRDGKGYAQSELSTAGEWSGTRTYWIQVHKMDSALTPLCDPQTADFVQGEQKAVYFIMKVATTPEPPEGDPAAKLRQIGDELRADLYTVAGELEAGQVTGGTLVLNLSDGRQAQFTIAPTVQAQGLRKLWVAIKAHLGRG